jgi:hypothetical protein
MKRMWYSVAALAAPLLACAEERRPAPPIDANPPAQLETATFALG